MTKEIEIIEMPDWLSKGEFDFNLQKILNDSLYYPGAGFDGTPVKAFTENVYSFVYVDYDVSKEENDNELEKNGFHCYHIIYRKSITIEELFPNKFIYKYLTSNID